MLQQIQMETVVDWKLRFKGWSERRRSEGLLLLTGIILVLILLDQPVTEELSETAAQCDLSPRHMTCITL